VIRSFVTTDKVDEIQQSENSFVNKIQQEIKAFQLKPDNKFCKDYYIEVAYHIDDYHKNGRLGQSTMENDQWKENLTRQLYAAYTDKFIKQAYYVFNLSDWASADLSFIRNEYQRLQSSQFLEMNNPINKRFNEINAIFNKYDEITSFISSCYGFSYTETGLDRQFPVEEVKSKISRAKSYRNNSLENSYVNNCTRLHNGLNDTPQVLFRAHVRYLDNIISTWSNIYSGYNSQRAYVDGLYNPLENKIEELDNNIYNVSDFDGEYSRLKRKWEADGERAYLHFDKN
jgi:hypothetical protein